MIVLCDIVIKIGLLTDIPICNNWMCPNSELDKSVSETRG